MKKIILTLVSLVLTTVGMKAYVNPNTVVIKEEPGTELPSGMKFRKYKCEVEVPGKLNNDGYYTGGTVEYDIEWPEFSQNIEVQQQIRSWIIKMLSSDVEDVNMSELRHMDTSDFKKIIKRMVALLFNRSEDPPYFTGNYNIKCNVLKENPNAISITAYVRPSVDAMISSVPDFFETLTFCPKSGKMLTSGMLPDIEQLRPLIQRHLYNSANERVTRENNYFLYKNLPLPKAMPIFRDKGVEFVYGLYEIAPPSEGTPYAEIPYDELASIAGADLHEFFPEDLAKNALKAGLRNELASMGLDTSATPEYVYNESKASEDNEIYDSEDFVEEFCGGSQGFFKILGQIRYPQEAAQADIEGSVIVNVVVEKNGTVSSATVKKSVHPALDKEACRVLRKAKGKAKIINGRAVRARYAVPVKFRLG